ncbi:uncharacterized protein LOC129909115 [Episyrphus balteatus]|uniref:uncharacterized protein LOC129909115 n=1 Tax=Episyrphus balteatus TaxID=286459 RepID=UPI002486CDB0|nr:uncharacterized protein LOC129909115 [Episyrphus balteatus]
MDENMQLCRICISNSECATMIPIFGEDLLWKKITMLADVKIEKGDTLPQQVCIVCAKAAISACMFKKKCEDADNFFRHHLQMMRKMENLQRGGADVITISEGSDNDPNDDNMNLANRHLLTSNNPSLQIMNGNSSNSGVGGGQLDQIDNKNNYDMNSIRMMMSNYLLEQQTREADAMASVNGYHNEGGGFAAPPCDVSMDDDQLPLIPEIELITPNDEETTVNRQEIANSQGQGYQCSICYQIFVRKFLLKDHMQSCHGRSPPVYECTNCRKSYLYKRFLEKHIRRGRCVKKRRNQTRPMECTDCHVLFPTGHHLGWHKRTGCPSRASKVPLQQLFKQNIVQYNNFPKPLIPPRKPDNALFMQNKRILPNSSKRKGRTRIKLDAKKIALAKILILKEATTTQIAQELDISRTFAWRLRKNLVNGVSLHERFIDPPAEEKAECINQTGPIVPQMSQVENQQINLGITNEQNDEIKPENAENIVEIKQEIQDDDEDKEEEDDNDDDTEDDSDDDDDSSDSDSDSDDDDEDDDDNDDEQEDDPNKSKTEQINLHGDEQTIKLEQNYQSSYTNSGHNHMQQQIEQTNYNGVTQNASEKEMPPLNQMNVHNEKNNSDSDEEDGEDNDDDDEEDDDDDDEGEDSDEEDEGADKVEDNESHMQRYKQHLMQSLPSVFHIPQTGFPQPVNLSIKSVQSQHNALTATTKKPRKPNVFIDDEKYATAKILVSQNSSTMEIARQLNVSQMTAWKLRDAIVKGIPLSYRSKRETRPKPPEKPQKPEASSTPKEKMPRRRLKAADRELRDREITREILEMIKEDSNIQYWKISAKLADKGYAISPSSVCQKLKALGIHRRWKPGDKPPILDMDSLKTNNSGGGGIGGGAGGFGGGTSTDSFEFNNEHQFELGGAHFLSAFTH